MVEMQQQGDVVEMKALRRHWSFVRYCSNWSLWLTKLSCSYSMLSTQMITDETLQPDTGQNLQLIQLSVLRCL